MADLTRLELARPVDAILSTATFHWIADHDALFTRLLAALRPGGRLVAQCGGEGNVAEVAAAAIRVGEREPFAPHLAGWPNPWYFASPAATAERLLRLGYTDVWTWRQHVPVAPRGPASSTSRPSCSAPTSSASPSPTARRLRHRGPGRARRAGRAVRAPEHPRAPARRGRALDSSRHPAAPSPRGPRRARSHVAAPLPLPSRQRSRGGLAGRRGRQRLRLAVAAPVRAGGARRPRPAPPGGHRRRRRPLRPRPRRRPARLAAAAARALLPEPRRHLRVAPRAAAAPRRARASPRSTPCSSRPRAPRGPWSWSPPWR